MIDGGDAALSGCELLEAWLRRPNTTRRLRVEELLDEAALKVTVSESIAKRAAELERAGIASRDALHLACSESAGCKHFVTCDDQLIRRAARFGKLSCEVINPVDLVRRMNP